MDDDLQRRAAAAALRQMALPFIPVPAVGPEDS